MIEYAGIGALVVFILGVLAGRFMWDRVKEAIFG